MLVTTSLVLRAIAIATNRFVIYTNYKSSSCIVGKGLTPAVGLS